MAYIRCDVMSSALRMGTSFVAIIPEQGAGENTPVLYLLHGLSDSCTAWTRYTSIERYANEKKMAVIMPEVQRSFYTDMIFGLPYFKYITEELPELCYNLFRLPKEKKNNYVMGLSMGGYGAMKCALNYPEKYAGCAAFSAAMDMRGILKDIDNNQIFKVNEAKACFGQELILPENCDLAEVLKKKEASELPPFYITCGEQDTLYEANDRMVQALEEHGCEVTFEHWEGDHTWAVWDRSVRQAIDKLIR